MDSKCGQLRMQPMGMPFPFMSRLFFNFTMSVMTDLPCSDHWFVPGPLFRTNEKLIAAYEQDPFARRMGNQLRRAERVSFRNVNLSPRIDVLIHEMHNVKHFVYEGYCRFLDNVDIANLLNVAKQIVSVKARDIYEYDYQGAAHIDFMNIAGSDTLQELDIGLELAHRPGIYAPMELRHVSGQWLACMVRNCPNLRKFTLTGGIKITWDLWRVLLTHPSIQEVTLDRVHMEDAGYITHPFHKVSNLRSLKIFAMKNEKLPQIYEKWEFPHLHTLALVKAYGGEMMSNDGQFFDRFINDVHTIEYGYGTGLWRDMHPVESVGRLIRHAISNMPYSNDSELQRQKFPNAAATCLTDCYLFKK